MFNDKQLKNVSDAVSKVMENSAIEKIKDEVDQIEEGIEDKLEAARAKAKASGKTIKGPAKASKSNVTKVAGKAYGGSAQKDDEEDDEDDDTPKKASKKGVFKRRYNTKVYKEQFSHLLDSYVNGGLKSIMEDLEVVEEEQVEEEATNDEFKKELEDAKAKSEGKKKADVAAASVQAVKNEEVEQIEERTLTEPEMDKREHLVEDVKRNGTKKPKAGAKEKTQSYTDREHERKMAASPKDRIQKPAGMSWGIYYKSL